ncbi:MAG TPA: DUF6588 family protein [Bacteriovoracaceae bacterium]|nr:DUF6588 family protein [Bacteriovoracaceae bacterium]
MIKLLATLLGLSSLSAFAAGPELPNMSKSDLEKVSNEFANNFSHTAVAAPETDGLWGLEIGLIAGQTGSPKLADLIDRAGEDGSEFKNLYHAGLMGRAHFPLDLFVELSVLPEKELADVTFENTSLGLGWNAGAHFGLPLDVALGYNMSNTDVSFKQTINNSSTAFTDVDSTINFAAKTSVYWLGVSKTLAIVTPYVKAGVAKSESDAEVTGSSTATIFTFTSNQKENVSSSGGYLAAGANLQLALFKMGLEASQTIGVKRISAKLSLDF